MGGENGKEELLLSPESIERLYDMHQLLSDIHPIVRAEIPQMKILLSTISNALDTISNAAKSMAETNQKSEERFSRMEDRLQSANDRAAGRAQIPLTSHLLILGSTVFITILVVLYVHRQTVDATLTSIKVQHEAN